MKDHPCIRIGHLKIVDHLILGIADLQAKKDSEILACSSLETIAMNSWDQICDSLTEGDITGAFITSPLAMDLFATGLDIRILMFAHRSGSMIVKKKGSGMNTLTSFKDKTVLVPSELSIQNMLLHRFLSAAGLTLGSHDDPSADVFNEVVNPYLMTEMITNDPDGDIAGFAVEEPFGCEAVHQEAADIVCTSDSLWEGHPCCVFVLKASLVEQYPEAVDELVSLFLQTGQHLEQERDHHLLSMAQHFLGQKKEVIHQVLCATGVRFDPSLLVPDIEALEMIQDYIADTMGVLKNKIEMNHLVDNSFILNRLSESIH